MGRWLRPLVAASGRELPGAVGAVRPVACAECFEEPFGVGELCVPDMTRDVDAVVDVLQAGQVRGNASTARAALCMELPDALCDLGLYAVDGDLGSSRSSEPDEVQLLQPHRDQTTCQADWDTVVTCHQCVVEERQRRAKSCRPQNCVVVPGLPVAELH